MGRTSSTVKNRYNAKHYKHITIALKFEVADMLDEICKEKGISRAKFIEQAIEKMKA